MAGRFSSAKSKIENLKIMESQPHRNEKYSYSESCVDSSSSALPDRDCDDVGAQDLEKGKVYELTGKKGASCEDLFIEDAGRLHTAQIEWMPVIRSATKHLDYTFLYYPFEKLVMMQESRFSNTVNEAKKAVKSLRSEVERVIIESISFAEIQEVEQVYLVERLKGFILLKVTQSSARYLGSECRDGSRDSFPFLGYILPTDMLPNGAFRTSDLVTVESLKLLASNVRRWWNVPAWEISEVVSKSEGQITSGDGKSRNGLLDKDDSSLEILRDLNMNASLSPHVIATGDLVIDNVLSQLVRFVMEDQSNEQVSAAYIVDMDRSKLNLTSFPPVLNIVCKRLEPGTSVEPLVDM